MQRIASFQIDHTRLEPGMYTSRADGDIVTYDLRFVRPNTPPYLETAAMHTIEHLFATYVRNSTQGEAVIYFGPMGCRTGFYFLVRGIKPEDAIRLTRAALTFIADFSGPVPGVSAEECGNCREHDLPKAREYARDMLHILENWTPPMLAYPC